MYNSLHRCSSGFHTIGPLLFLYYINDLPNVSKLDPDLQRYIRIRISTNWDFTTTGALEDN